MKTIRYEELLRFTRSLLEKVGLDKETGEAVAYGLCETSLRGVDSHGVRLLSHYARSALTGRKNPRPKYRFEKIFPAFGYLDADNTYGHAAGGKAIDLAMPIAEEFGIAAIAVTNSSHPGALATYVLRAARQGYIAFAFTHADSLLCTYGGTRAFFGTNPICMAAPRENSEPFCLDMAPTPISWNKLLGSRERNEQLSGKYAADHKGNETDDPHHATTLLPIGDYKGYGIAAMVEVLCGILTGMPFGRDIPAMFTSPMDRPRHLGQFYLVMRSDVCMSQLDFENRMKRMSEQVANEPVKPGEEVLLPNDVQIREEKRRRAEGIPVEPRLFREFVELSQQFGVDIEILSDIKTDAEVNQSKT